MNRIDLAYAVVYNHSFRIDPYAGNTVDRAYFGGHYYSSQSIGAVMPSAAILAAYRLLSGDNNPDPYNAAPLYLITFLLVSLPSALLAVILFGYLERFSNNIPLRAAATLSFSFGTLVFPYSTLFYSYLPGVFLCFAVFVMIETGRTAGSVSRTKGLFAGFLLSYAAVTSNECAVIALPIAVYAFFRMKRKPDFVFYLAGAIPPALLLAAYNKICFGTPFTMAFFHTAVPEWGAEVKRGLLGIHAPRISELWKLTFAPGRGLFWVSPFLLFSIPGFAVMLKKKESRGIAALFVSAILLMLYFNSIFRIEIGGMSPGPRYLTVIIIFLMVAVFEWIERPPAVWRAIFVVLTIVSAGAMTIVTATTPHVPGEIRSPFFAFALPLFLDGCLTWNAGRLLALDGIASIIPLVVFAGIAVVALFVFVRSGRGGVSEANPRAKPGAGAWLIAVCAGAAFVAAGYFFSDLHSRDAHILRGTYLKQSGMYEAAIRELTAALKSPGEKADLYSDRAAAHVALRRYREAVSDFESVLESRPGDIFARHNAARILKYYLNDNAGAARHYRIIMSGGGKIPPGIAFEAHLAVGLEMENSGDFDGAAEQYAAAAKLGTANVKPLLMAANLYVKMYNRDGGVEHLERASAALENALGIAPEHKKALESLAVIYMIRKEYYRAYRVAGKLISLDEKNETAQRILESVMPDARPRSGIKGNPIKGGR